MLRQRVPGNTHMLIFPVWYDKSWLICTRVRWSNILRGKILRKPIKIGFIGRNVASWFCSWADCFWVLKFHRDSPSTFIHMRMCSWTERSQYRLVIFHQIAPKRHAIVCDWGPQYTFLFTGLTNMQHFVIFIIRKRAWHLMHVVVHRGWYSVIHTISLAVLTWTYDVMVSNYKLKFPNKGNTDGDFACFHSNHSKSQQCYG